MQQSWVGDLHEGKFIQFFYQNTACNVCLLLTQRVRRNVTVYKDKVYGGDRIKTYSSLNLYDKQSEHERNITVITERVTWRSFSRSYYTIHSVQATLQLLFSYWYKM
jgi:hypothetical protein